MNRTERSGLIAALTIPALFMTACRRAETPEEVAVRQVRAMTVADFAGLSARSFPGRAAATQEVDLAFWVSGPLIARPVNVGDKVEEGDLVASIDPRDFEVNLRNAKAQLQEAKAVLALAEEQHERGKDVYELDAVSPIELARLRETENRAQANVAALEASVVAAQDALDDTQLLAPFAGTIVTTYVENFQQVRRGQMIVRLLDHTRIELEVNIPETLISLVPDMSDLRVRFDAFPDIEVPAEISEISTEASATTRTFPVTLVMDQPAGATILPGMAGRVSGTARPPSGAEQPNIVIPVTAVFSLAGDGSYVWVIDDDTLSRREVQLGQLISGGYVIEAGLAPGEMIATAGVHFLVENLQVIPYTE